MKNLKYLSISLLILGANALNAKAMSPLFYCSHPKTMPDSGTYCSAIEEGISRGNSNDIDFAVELCASGQGHYGSNGKKIDFCSLLEKAQLFLLIEAIDKSLVNSMALVYRCEIGFDQACRLIERAVGSNNYNINFYAVPLCADGKYPEICAALENAVKKGDKSAMQAIFNHGDNGLDHLGRELVNLKDVCTDKHIPGHLQACNLLNLLKGADYTDYVSTY